MVIHIQTEAQGGHIIVYVINSNGVKVLTVKDNGTGSCVLAPGYNYRFEFHVWGSQSADYSIHARVTPANEGFQDFDWNRHYEGPHQDMGGFYFKLLNL